MPTVRLEGSGSYALLLSVNNALVVGLAGEVAP